MIGITFSRSIRFPLLAVILLVVCGFSRMWAGAGRRSVKEAAAEQRFSCALAGRSMLHSDFCSCSRYTASAGNTCSTMSAEKWAIIAASNPRRQ